MKSSTMLSCSKHPDEKLKYWCKNDICRTLTCRDCLLFEHKDHEYALIDTIANEAKATVSK